MKKSLISLAMASMALLLASCGGGSSSEHSRASSAGNTKGASTSGLQVVALGDSETSGHGDPTGVGWVGRYARLLRTNLGLEANVSNLAQDGKSSADLLSDLRNDASVRTAVKRAQIVLLGIGGADLNAGDANFEAGKCRAEACYAPVLKSFARNFEAILASIRELRGPDKTVLRSITQPNVLTGAEDVIPAFLKPIATRIGLYQARTANRVICRTMRKSGGRCVELLSVFNGPTGTANAYKKGLLNHEDCCYPSAEGQQLMAELLFRTGLAPVR